LLAEGDFMSLKSAVIISLLAFALGFTIEAVSSPKMRQALESSVTESISELVADIRISEDIHDINAGRITGGLLDLRSQKKVAKARPAKIRQMAD
jgi:lipopolysaccharide export LptBFGC system permease protein LptF